MLYLILFFIIIGYFGMGILTYVLLKKDWMRNFGRWTKGTKAIIILFAATGPIGCLMSLSITLANFIYDIGSDYWDKPAKW